MTSHITRQIELERGTVQVDTRGDGRELVIIHSLLTGPEAFEEVVGELSNSLTIHRIYLPGFGASSPIDRPAISILDLADVVASTMTELGTAPEATVLGNGLGSFVALALAIHHGDRFGGLIVSNTGPGFPEGRKGAFLDMSRLATEGGMSAVADIAVARIFPPSFVEEHPEAPERRRQVLEEIDPGAFAAACVALSTLDLSDDLGRIANPTLVIVGAIDQTTPPEMGRAVADTMPNARLETIPDCGHCPQLEQPEALRDLVADFMGAA